MKILVLDGNSLVNRAFYGVKPLTTSGGTPTGAVYGFATMLRKLMTTEKPDGLCVCFDLPQPTFRHLRYEGYKAQRKGMPEELAVQLPLVRELLAALRIPAYSLPGYEADDLLGTISRRSSGCEVVLVTGDRDSYQLISDTTKVLYISSKHEHRLIDRDVFTEQYGFGPGLMIDLKALMGDSSDNIPGIAGIGEKTASDLLRRFGSLDGVFEHQGELKGKLRERIETGRDAALLSKELATIDTNVPLEGYSPETVRLKSCDAAALTALFRRLEFNKLLPQFIKHEEHETPEQPSLFGAPEAQESLPEGWGRDIKDIWREELDAGKELTPFRFDLSLAEYLLGGVSAEPEQALESLGMKELYYNIELPLCRTLAYMEHYGFRVDRPLLCRYSAELGERLGIVEEEIYNLIGRRVNILSPKQLGALLFEELKLPPVKKTKSGYSTDAEVLEKLKNHHPVVEKILEYRGISKLKSTYADGLLAVAGADDRIHTRFNMTLTSTGRLSSSSPNLQNIPIRKEQSLRRMFISNPGWVLVDADYSQIELRVLAHISGDSAMTQAFLDGEDIHAATAAKVFGVERQAVTKEMRGYAKAVNFGIVYGISAYSLSEDIGVSVYEAQNFIKAYFERYPGVKAYMEDIVRKAKADGYITTLLGRRRMIPELSSANHNIRSFGERVAMNTPIQGTAADIIKLAMVRVHEALEREGLQARLILQVHDEIIVECPESESERVLKLLRGEMENAYPLATGLLAEAAAGDNWLDAK